MPVPDTFDVDIEARGEELWVLPRGDLDLNAAPELRESLQLALRSDAAEIVIDLRGLELLDSMGLKALISAHAGPEGHRVSFVRGGALVEQVLRVSGLDDELTFRTV
jgi:anti-sigma B factor antagonist